MGYTIIQKKDKQKMSEMVEDILYTAGRLMHCVDEMEEDGYGERQYRNGMGMRDGGRYGDRYMSRGYGNRYDDEPYDIMERRYRR